MPDIESLEISSPIPWHSLSTEPRSRPWERPSKYSDPEDALEYYVKQLTIPESTASMMEILESGLPAANLVDSITLAGVMQGLHTIDVAIIISQALFDLVTGIAEQLDVKYKNGLSQDTYGEDDLLVERAFANPEADKLQETFREEELEEVKKAVDKTSVGLMAKTVEEGEV